MVRKRKINFLAIFVLVFAIVLTSVILSFGNQVVINTNAYNSASAVPTSLGSLTLNEYQKRSDGQVFDPAVLAKLYGAITGNTTDTYKNALDTVNLSKSEIIGTTTVAAKNKNTQNQSMNFTQIKEKNKAYGNIPVVVEFGGYTWNVVYLTTNTNDNSVNGGKKGDLIATLWMSETLKNDSSVIEVPWTGFSTASTSTSGDYSGNEYSMSKIRVDTLNCGNTDFADTQYATGTALANLDTVTASQRVTNEFAKFTMSNAALAGTSKSNQSLINFLATPAQVNYQIAENFVWSYTYTGNPYLLLNEAWGSGSDGKTGPDTTLTYQPTGKPSASGGWSNKGTANDMNDVIDNVNYFDWKNDYIWLPSLTETGFYRAGSTGYGISLWGIEVGDDFGDDILLSDSEIWLRSGDEDNASVTKTLRGSGTYYAPLNSESHAIRPALHINLTAAQKNVELQVPKNVFKTYNGAHQDVESETWFTDEFKNSVDITYYNGSTPMTTKPMTVGSYEVAFTIKSGCEKMWSDGNLSSKTRRITFVIEQKAINFPTWLDKNDKDYNGSGKLYFTLSDDYDHDAITIDVPTALKSKVTFAGEEFTVTDLDAGTYTMDVSLKDAKNYRWASTSGNELKFTVNPYTIQIEDLSDGGNRTLLSSRDSTLTLSLKTNVNTLVHSGKQVKVNIVAATTGLTKIVGSATLDSSPTSRDQLIDVKFVGTPDGRTYTLTVEIDDTTLDGKNYAIEQDFTTTVKLEEGVRSVLTWQLTANGVDVFGEYTDSNVNVEKVAFGGTPIVYDGKEYGFRVLLPTGYTLDTGFGVGGFEVVPDTAGNSAPGVNADSYTTKVGLKDSDSAPHVYQLTWQINKAKFDLTNVKWLNDGKMEYDDGNLIHPSIDPSTLPDGLLVDRCDDLGGYNVGPCGTATITFKLADDFKDNYELPVDGGKDSNYTFAGGGDFEWNKEWSIVPAVFILEWMDKSVTDLGGNTFSVRVLKDPRADGKVDYVYYLTDVSGTILDPNPLAEDEIEFSATDRKYYKAYPTIHSGFDTNYSFPAVSDDKLYSGVFSVGGGSSSVTVSLDSDSIEYTGKPVNLKINIIGAAKLNDLVLTFYSGDMVDPANLLDGAPTVAGNYLVVITSNKPTVILGGTTQFEFAITRSRISTDWKAEAKPPVLNLKFGQLAGIAYDIVDSSDNPISSVKDMTPDNYKIRARITDTVNFIFDDDTVVTDWQEFTVREGDTLYDPADPANPSNPVDPDNPNGGNNGGDNNGDGGIGDKIKDFFNNLIEQNFPLWQICTIAAGGLLSLIFMIKAIQYGNRRRKAKGEAKKISAKTYAALLPIFATDVVLAGLSNKIWSIIAFAMVGVTVLMFLIAIITRRGWKKAELAKEQAIEDSEQRRIDADRQEREAEKQERREFQERMVQVGSSGGAAGGADMSIIEEMRRQMEEQRRADEERHRQEMEAMKLMLANMMGRSQMDNGDMPYASMDDTDLLVQKVIAGLLPAVQQMMPEPTAYLAAPSQETEELKALVAEQSETMRNMADKIDDLQNQLADMSHNVLDAEIIPDNSEELRAMAEEHNARIDEQNAQIEEQNNQIAEQNAQIAELQDRIDELMQGRVEAELLPDQSEEIRALTEQIEQLKSQIAENGAVVVNADNSEELRALAEAHSAEIKALSDEHSAEMQAMSAAMNAKLAEMQSKMDMMSSMSVDELDDEDFDDEEEWDSILDEDDDDFVEAIIIDEGGKERKVYPNFRMRLKQSSDKNREWYAVIKNLFCSQKGVTYRVYKRVEKIRYQGQVIAVIGIAKRSIKLWLALKPYEYDARRYHHKDVSDKPRFVDVPMYVRVSSDRALDRSQELILALFQELNMEARKRYTDRPIQELIFTLKHNRLLTNKQNKQLLCETMHVHDCDVLDDETAEKCIEAKNVEFIDDSNIETVKLDDIDAKFQDGNRVTLDRLKKVGLVSEDCTGFTVTADKRLTKPLIIVANDFTLTAVKLIALTGGRAIKLQTV